MKSSPLDLVSALPDEELVGRVALLARRERDATVELVVHLAELDARKLYLALGYGSPFSYCTRALRLSEHSAYNRIEAARACRRFPRILERLAEGSLNLSTLRLLAPHLTAGNCDRLLDQASGRTKREVEALVARLAPSPDVPAMLRKLPDRKLPEQPTGGRGAIEPQTQVGDAGPCAAAVLPGLSHSDTDAGGHTLPAEAALGVSTGTSGLSTHVGPAPARRPEVAPLSAGRYRLQCTVDQETHDQLRRLQDLLRREIPDGDPGRIVARALKLLLGDVARKKLTATTRAIARTARAEQGATPATGSRHVPAHVRRGVWQRDGGQCAFVGRRGQRCHERAFLEIHHVEPYAIGGEATLSNLSLRCRAHNAHEARLVFGAREHTRPPTAVTKAVKSSPIPDGGTRPGASRSSSKLGSGRVVPGTVGSRPGA